MKTGVLTTNSPATSTCTHRLRRTGGVYAFKPSARRRLLEVDFAGSGGGRITSFPDGIDCEADCGAIRRRKTRHADGYHQLPVEFPRLESRRRPRVLRGHRSLRHPARQRHQGDGGIRTVATAPLTVSKLGSGEGAVTSSPNGIDCGSTCASTFNDGSSVTLTATPAEHSSFTGWQVTGSPGACPGTGTCWITMSAGQTVSATFAPIPQQTLSVSMAGNGAGSVVSDRPGSTAANSALHSSTRAAS